MQPFDLFSTPLDGTCLIEAGAGTGKTYTITGLYLRLLIEKQLSCDQILVVTFTTAATDELKDRIRKRIADALSVIQGSDTDDPELNRLRDDIDDARLAARQLQLALADFDRAAIFTIHGFCQRLLQQCAFETGVLFDTELVQDATPIISESVDDFWRRHVLTAPEPMVAYIQQQVRDPSLLIPLVRRACMLDTRILPHMQQPALSALEPFCQAAESLIQQWLDNRSAVMDLLASPSLDGRRYGSLKPSPKAGPVTGRQRTIDACVAEIDLWAFHSPQFWPLPEKIDKLGSAAIELATRKHMAPPTHPWCEHCQRVIDLAAELEQQMAAYWLYLQLELIRRLPGQLKKKKANRHIWFFDDLLSTVHAVLNGPHRRRLEENVGQHYRAALVDEFQDTDSVQYDIFSRLFGRTGTLFMIGDPKQSIYGFRGADIFSYLKASRDAVHRYTLLKNWRSSPRMIQAVNAFFSGHRAPFVLPSIGFSNATSAHEPGGGLRCNTDTALDAPLRLWYLTATMVKHDTLTHDVAIERIIDAVADEIVDLISDAAHPVLPGQIAILTRSHRQARAVKDGLADRRIPAVLYSAGSVFDTPESAELVAVMQAVARPTDDRCLRAALTCESMGWDAWQLVGDHDDDHKIVMDCRAQFSRLQRLWITGGFFPMIQQWMHMFQIKARLLSLPNGERRLTNLLHLAELAHHHDSQTSPGMAGLIKWLQRQRLNRHLEDEAQQLRLESDDDAVKILTIHKSKGLEFDVVFCPFLWSGTPTDDQSLVFHDPNHDFQRTFLVGKHRTQPVICQAEKETLSEQLRLLYVTLTRAKQRCYLVWGRFPNADRTALAYLLHGRDLVADADDAIDKLKARWQRMDDQQFHDDLAMLSSRSKGAVSIVALPGSRARIFAPPAAPVDKLQCRTLLRPISRRWVITSFSALAKGAGDRVDDTGLEPLPDRDEPLQGAMHAIADDVVSDAVAVAGRQDIFGFPRGVQAGLFFHELLEQLDFRRVDRADTEDLVTGLLSRYGYPVHWQPVVQGFIQRLVSRPLNRAFPALCLNQIAPAVRINEMAFYFPLSAFSRDRLRAVFQDNGHPELNSWFDGPLGRLAFKPSEGFMKGYIDLVFEFDGRYFLIDWKSNYLGSRVADYGSDRLKSSIAEDYYFLQYHLYTVALDQWLKTRLPRYRYADHFGGVFYVYLRGIGSGPVTDSGVFFDRPRPELIKALNRLMMARPQYPVPEMGE